MSKRNLTKLCVLYLRMSSDKQDKSLGSQRAELVAHAKKHGYTIVAEYVDEGISGDATHRRAGFLKMVADAQNGEFSIILCWDQDRFGRFDSLEAGFYVHPLRNAGVSLETVTDGPIDWNDFSGRVMYTLKQEAKHQFLLDLSKNTIRGRLSRLRECQWCQPRPFGYLIGEDGRLVPHPVESMVVSEIFRRRALGQSFLEIARWLDGTTHKPPRAASWDQRQIRRMVVRRTYIGILVIGEQSRSKYHDNSRSEIIEDAHPAIVDRETFDAVQAIGKRGTPRGPSKRGPGAPLAGLLFCGDCGHAFYPIHNTSRWPLYCCGQWHRFGDCNANSVPQGKTLDMVSSAIRRHVLGTSMGKLEQHIGKRLKAKTSQTNFASVRKQLLNLEAKIQRGAERLLNVSDELVPAVESQLTELHGQRKRLQEQVAPRSRKSTQTAGQIAQHIWALDEILRSADAAMTRQTLNRIVDSITLNFRPTGQRNRKTVFDGGKIQLSKRGQQSSP